MAQSTFEESWKWNSGKTFSAFLLTLRLMCIPVHPSVSGSVSVGNMTSFSMSKVSYTRPVDNNLTTWTPEKNTPIRRLTRDLLWLYDPNVRPILNFSNPLQVTHYFLLQQVIYLDSKEQKLKAFFFEVWIWKDEYLTWDPQDFDNITKITLMRENLWLPDIVVFNQVGENSNYYMRENIIPATIESTGSIRLDTPQKYETTCLIEIENFPFDIQTCLIIVGSWSQAADTIVMANLSSNMDSISYIENSEWNLIKTNVVAGIFVYEGSSQEYSEIHYTIILERRLAFYNRNLIIPMILISFMAQLVFLLPPESGEKISLAITVFLALSLNMLVISEYIPANSLQTPIASKYCLFSMFLVCLSLWLSVLVLNLQGSESASYLYSSKPSSKVMRVAKVFGPWLLVGGGPSKKANLAGGGTTFLNSRPRASMKHLEETTHVFVPTNHVAFENHVDNNHSSSNNHLMPPPVNTGHGFLNDQRHKTSRYSNVVSGSPTQMALSGQRSTIYYSLGDSMDNGGPDTLMPNHASHQLHQNHAPHNQQLQHPGKQSPLDYSNPSINIISGNNNMNSHNKNNNNYNNINNNNNNNNNHSSSSSIQQPQPNLEGILETFVERLEAIQTAHLNRNEMSDSTKEMLEEWGYLARVVDRFFAAVYFLVNVLCLIPFVPFYLGWAN